MNQHGKNRDAGPGPVDRGLVCSEALPKRAGVLSRLPPRSLLPPRPRTSVRWSSNPSVFPSYSFRSVPAWTYTGTRPYSPGPADYNYEPDRRDLKLYKPWLDR